MNVKTLRELLSDYDDEMSVIVINDDASSDVYGITDTDDNVVLLAHINSTNPTQPTWRK
jgi:hypothetical protein